MGGRWVTMSMAKYRRSRGSKWGLWGVHSWYGVSRTKVLAVHLADNLVPTNVDSNCTTGFNSHLLRISESTAMLNVRSKYEKWSFSSSIHINCSTNRQLSSVKRQNNSFSMLTPSLMYRLRRSKTCIHTKCSRAERKRLIPSDGNYGGHSYLSTLIIFAHTINTILYSQTCSFNGYIDFLKDTMTINKRGIRRFK